MLGASIVKSRSGFGSSDAVREPRFMSREEIAR
jgi:hypothetical protein